MPDLTRDKLIEVTARVMCRRAYTQAFGLVHWLDQRVEQCWSRYGGAAAEVLDAIGEVAAVVPRNISDDAKSDLTKVQAREDAGREKADG